MIPNKNLGAAAQMGEKVIFLIWMQIFRLAESALKFSRMSLPGQLHLDYLFMIQGLIFFFKRCWFLIFQII